MLLRALNAFAGLKSDGEITKRSIWELFKAAPESEVRLYSLQQRFASVEILRDTRT